MKQLIRVVGVALLVIANVGAAAQTKLQCADSATSMKNVSANAAGTVLSTSTYTCAFSRPALALICQVSTSGIQQTTRMTYASVDDFVDQFTVTPHLTRLLKAELRGSGGDRDTIYIYDAKKRVIREDNITASGTTSLAWTEWDTAGRPTKGRWSSSSVTIGAPNDTITYDDKTKTMKRTTGGQVAGYLEIEMYKNGNQTVTTSNSNGVKFTSTMTTLTTEKICR